MDNSIFLCEIWIEYSDDLDCLSVLWIKTNLIWNLMQLKDRTDQSHGTWEEVYRNAKKADRSKHDLHERDDGELERTGQPLSIYEPYFGEGTWPFLHVSSLYRGIGLVSYQTHSSPLFM